MVGQTFYIFVLENLRQFGALKAMGVANLTILRMVLLQAMVVAGIGYAIGIGLCAGFFEITSLSRSTARLRDEFRAVAGRILEIDTRLRGAAVPADDKIWLHQRGEFETLQQLGKCHVLLVADAKELVSRVADLPADAGIDPASEQQIDQQLGRLAEARTRRDEILAVLR